MDKKTQNIALITLGALALGGLTYWHFNPSNAIVRRAKSRLGQEELAGNMGFKDPKFEEEMKEAGFVSGSQWCNIFAKDIWVNSLHFNKKELAKKLLTPSTQLTWANFKADKSGKFEILIPETSKNEEGITEIKKQPKKGALVVWQSYSNSAKGHIGIVVSSTKKFFKTIEGNSNNTYVKGQLRDLKKSIKSGDPLYSEELKSDSSEGAVSYHIRQYDGDGMKLLGFINI